MRKSARGTSITSKRPENHGRTALASMGSPLRARSPPRVRDQRAAPPRGGVAAVARSRGVRLPLPGPKLPGVGPQRQLPRARWLPGTGRGAWRRSRPLAASARRHRRSNSPRGPPPAGRGNSSRTELCQKSLTQPPRGSRAPVRNPDYPCCGQARQASLQSFTQSAKCVKMERVQE